MNRHVAVAALLLLGACTVRTDATAAPDLEVTLGEWFVQAEPNRVAPGDLRLVLRNDGGAHHSLTICESDDATTCEGDNVLQRYLEKPEEARSPEDLPDETDAPIIGAGWEAELAVTLEPGSYRLYCPLLGHPGRGMQSLLVVEDEAG